MSDKPIPEAVRALIEAAEALGHHSTLRSSSDDTIAYWKARVASLSQALTTAQQPAAVPVGVEASLRNARDYISRNGFGHDAAERIDEIDAVLAQKLAPPSAPVGVEDLASWMINNLLTESQLSVVPPGRQKALRYFAQQPLAEAQAQGGGEVVQSGWYYTDTGQYVQVWRITQDDGCWCSDLKYHCSSTLHTAPPSAPVGVEGLIKDWESDLAEDKRDGVSDVAIRVQEIHLDQLRALAQQPAAEQDCDNCGGFGDVSGEYPGDACPDCRGTGKVPAQQSAAPVLAKYQPCGCVICTCEDEQQCQGCGAKHCGNRTDHPPYVVQQPAAEGVSHE